MNLIEQNDSRGIEENHSWKEKKKKELLLLPRIELNTANPRNDSSDEFDRS